MNSPRPQRLDAILSRYGYCSRSEARDWLRAKRVLIEGKPATSPSDKALAGDVLIDGEPIDFPNGMLILMHKPAGFVCSHDEREGRRIYELLPERWNNRNPAVTTIGRLDKDTTGVLFLTDDGEIVQKWTSPKHKVVKVYEVTLDKPINPEIISVFASGSLQLEGEDKPCLPARLELIAEREARLELVEGKYHQVKRMFASQGLTVTKLHRSQFGEFTVAGLAPGEWQEIPLNSVSF